MEPLYIGALDIGGTKMAATVATAQGPLARITQPTVKVGTADAPAAQGIAMLRAACEQAGIDHRLLSTVGVSSCGPFARNEGLLGLVAPNLCGGLKGSADLPNDWEAIPLERVLRTQFGNVVIENDCVAALVAERTFGAVRDEPDCVYVTWSTGIGFGLCVDGRIMHGKHGNAGHAGHMLMDGQSDALCGCGNRGDLEAMISGRNLGNRLGRPTAELFSAARSGEPAAQAVVAEAARWLGRGLYNVAVTLDTRVFVIGGSVWEHHGDWLAPMVRHELDTRLQSLTAGVSVVGAALGPLVADVGALRLVMPAAWVADWRETMPWRSLAIA
ncbi:MAG: ROK family protein [Pseudomonadota bacterium]